MMGPIGYGSCIYAGSSNSSIGGGRISSTALGPIGPVDASLSHAPTISNQDTLTFGANSFCHAYTNAPDFSSWNRMQCLQVECAFYANSKSEFLPRACLAADKSIRD